MGAGDCKYSYNNTFSEVINEINTENPNFVESFIIIKALEFEKKNIKKKKKLFHFFKK